MDTAEGSTDPLYWGLNRRTLDYNIQNPSGWKLPRVSVVTPQSAKTHYPESLGACCLAGEGAHLGESCVDRPLDYTTQYANGPWLPGRAIM